MTTVSCPSCWAVNDSAGAFCRECGARLPRPPVSGTRRAPGADDSVFPLIRNFPGWILLSMGIAFAVAGVLLLLLYGIVASATSLAGSTCAHSGSTCGGAIFQFVFLLPGACLLILGAAFIGLVLYYALPPH